jgi:adenylate kinase
MKFIFFGPPGAGKGTLAQRVAQVYQIPHISTGDIFRAAIKAQTPLGKKIYAIISAGALVNDDVTATVVKERLEQSDARKGFILDGFPRTILQAESLDAFSVVDAVVNFAIADAAVVARLLGRRVCKNCGQNYHLSQMPSEKEGICDKCGQALFIRDDDKIESITHRLEIYHKQTAPLIEYYRNKKLLSYIDACPKLEVVLNDFMRRFPTVCCN